LAIHNGFQDEDPMKHRALFIVLLLATAALSGIVIGRFASCA
jgi:hypothetical protein